MQITRSGSCESESVRVGADVNCWMVPDTADRLTVPIVMACGLLFSPSCSSGESVLVSPSGEYVAFLSIQSLPEGYGVWVVNVTGGEDRVLLAEVMPDHPASLMAYLAWDDDDRLWWYGSDDGSVFYWVRSGTAWTRLTYSSGGDEGPVPPPSLFTCGNRTRSGR